MNEYTLYCTKDQTKKVLELGATLTEDRSDWFNTANHICVGDTIFGDIWYHCPTVEQMFGFFRSKNIHIVIHKDAVDKWSVYGHEIMPIEFTVFDRLTGFDSYEEATLAAIDAILEYLEQSTK